MIFADQAQQNSNRKVDMLQISPELKVNLGFREN
jgi:hypothetical protein